MVTVEGSSAPVPSATWALLLVLVAVATWAICQVVAETNDYTDQCEHNAWVAALHAEAPHEFVEQLQHFTVSAHQAYLAHLAFGVSVAELSRVVREGNRPIADLIETLRSANEDGQRALDERDR